MTTYSRREFVKVAAMMGAAMAWSGPARASGLRWDERRDLFPEGVGSGDPDPHSVILWTRRPFTTGKRHPLRVEVAEDEAFRRVVATARAPVSKASDWTARVLVGGLKPARVYWYRFTDADGNGSRIGRTITAPLPDDPRTVNFAFVSCQDVNEGKLDAYRRMIFEDEHAPPEDRLGFVLHLGDFIYEVVEYPDEVKTRYDRTIYEVCRIPDGGVVGKFHYPLTVDGYRAVYRGYLADPDLQDARARWPFVAIWDNHEFSWQGWQSIQQAGGPPRPGQTIKVAANQAWFEYIPARVKAPSGSLEQFGPPALKNVAIDKWDEHGVGIEPNNLAAINSLKAYRALRYGQHLDLIITDQHSYRSADPFSDPAVGKLGPEFFGMFPEPAAQILDGGRACNGAKPPAEISFNDARVPNPQKNSPPQTILGAEQKGWFKEQLRRSTATWKIWGNSQGTPDSRTDPQNLPAGLTKESWPKDSYASLSTGDYGTAYLERGEIFSMVREAKITGFAIVSGDRHSFWAGYASTELPPGKFDPVGLTFVGASLTSPGAMEAYEHSFPKDHPLRPLFLADRANGAKPDRTFNMLLKHGVRSCLEYARSFDLARARSLSNPAVSPHLEFVDMGGHGYATVRLTAEEMRTEFVCIPRPVTRSSDPNGGPLRYRVVHTAALWGPGERPHLKQEILEGDVGLSI
ncbi:MAG TPA: alkaline phosphatase D family protein [Chthoniobacterales bacterium]|nr:alkaline phosphatase D family protein [Chthoniobacterales bacterium]